MSSPLLAPSTSARCVLSYSSRSASTLSLSGCVPQIIQRLGDFWSSCAQIRSQLTFLKIKYPLALTLLPVKNAAPSLKVTATVLFLAVRAKAYISFVFDAETYTRWPLTIAALKTDVEVAYGGIE